MLRHPLHTSPWTIVRGSFLFYSLGMIIRKYLHSCILLEQDGYRLLFDPGRYSFIEGRLKPEDIPTPDVIVITHEHGDHYDPDAIATIAKTKGAELIVPTGFSAPLPDGLPVTRVEHSEELRRGSFTIKPLDAPHEALPQPVPVNLAFLVNDRFLHPGDSLSVRAERVEVLALPVTAPWMRSIDGMEFVQRLHPKVAVPIHDASVKDFSLKTLYERNFSPNLKKLGIEFRPLGLGEALEC